MAIADMLMKQMEERLDRFRQDIIKTLADDVKLLEATMQVLHKTVRDICPHERWKITKLDEPPLVASQAYLCHKWKITPTLRVTCLICGHIVAHYPLYRLPRKYRKAAKAQGLWRDYGEHPHAI